jgi:hypothetical protein
MRILRGATLALCLLALLGTLTSMIYGADVTGQWKSQAGDDPAFAFTLKSDGKALTGTMLGRDGKELPISDGTLDGDRLSFSVMSEWQGNPIKLVAKGTVKGGEINLNIGTDNGAWSTDTTLKRAAESGK